MLGARSTVAQSGQELMAHEAGLLEIRVKSLKRPPLVFTSSLVLLYQDCCRYVRSDYITSMLPAALVSFYTPC